MYRKLSKLVIYRKLEKDCILYTLAEIFKTIEENRITITSDDVLREEVTSQIYTQIHRLLDIATEYGFDHNLWKNYLSYILATNENPFSITCEKVGANEGTVNSFAKNDFWIFKELFDYDFSYIEKLLNINCTFSLTFLL